MGQGGVNDWDVAIWFDLSAVVYNAKGHKHGVYLIGKSSKRKKIEQFGIQLLTFLLQEGVKLTIPDAKLLGQEGNVIEDFRWCGGRVSISGEDVIAHPQYYPVKKGDRVYVSEIRGTSLYITKSKSQ
jgi:hypothetical protein